MIKYRLIHDKECLCKNLTSIEASDLIILYKEQHPDWKLEIQEYNFDPGGRHWGRDPDLH